MIGRAGESSLRAGLLLSVPAIVAWLTGLPFVFPSLGPTAYLLAIGRRGGAADPRRVLVGHSIGVVAGLAAHAALAPGLVLTAASPAYDPDLLRLAAAGTLSVAATTAGMLRTDAVHPPACATTLIVSLGLLSTPVDGGIIILAVAALVAVHLAAVEYLGPPPEVFG